MVFFLKYKGTTWTPLIILNDKNSLMYIYIYIYTVCLVEATDSPDADKETTSESGKEYKITKHHLSHMYLCKNLFIAIMHQKSIGLIDFPLSNKFETNLFTFNKIFVIYLFFLK